MYVYNVTHQHSLPYMDVVRCHLVMIIMGITKMIIFGVMMIMIRNQNYAGHDDNCDDNHDCTVDHLMTSSSVLV